MTASEIWSFGVAAVLQEYEGFPSSRKSSANKLAAEIKICKERLHRIAEEVGAAGICSGCGGDCCKNGKNHVKAVDLIIYLKEEKPIFDPGFEREICPHLGDRGCLMEPGYRPYNCITFICEKVDDLLDHDMKERFVFLERKLRALYRELECFLDHSLRYSLLSVFERQYPNNLVGAEEKQ